MKRINLNKLIMECITEVLRESVAPGLEDVSVVSLQDFINKSINEDIETDWEDLKTKPAPYSDIVQKKKEGDPETGKMAATKVGKLIHRSNIVDENGNFIDEDELKQKIKIRPKNILGQNAKIKHSGKNIYRFYDTSIPAYQGLYVDEKTNELKVVTTCPAAGACKKFCYAAKGNYIMCPPVAIRFARLINYLLNDWAGFKQQLVSEITTRFNIDSKKGIKTVIRWHDSGDFFSPKYLQLAYDIANETPDVIHYAYTKAYDIVSKSNPPDNFVFNFSTGGKFDKSIDTKTQKHADVVPYNVFDDLMSSVQGKRKSWEFSNENLKTLKQRISQKYDIPLSTVITYDELVDKPYDPKIDTKKKYNVIVWPGHGDDSAMRKDVLGTYLLIH